MYWEENAAMSNSASEKMLQAVSAIKESAARAEREYESDAGMLQMKASSSIDLFGGECGQSGSRYCRRIQKDL